MELANTDSLLFGRYLPVPFASVFFLGSSSSELPCLFSKYIVATMYFENKQGNSDEEEPRKNTLANGTGRYLPKSRESVLANSTRDSIGNS